MAKVRIKTYPKRVENEVSKQGRKGIMKSIVFLEAAVKNAMRSTPRVIASKVKRGRNIHHPSAPGHPPAVDFGRYINSISHAFSWGGAATSRPTAPAKSNEGVTSPAAKSKKDTGVTGSSVAQVIPLEFGTAKTQARPVWRQTLVKSRAQLATFFKVR